MRIIFLALGALSLAACRSYTPIDSENWDDFSKDYRHWNIEFSLPGGYVVERPYNGDRYIQVDAYLYDVLQGTGIYGSAWGETRIAFLIAQEEVTDTAALVRRRLASDLSDCLRIADPNWARISCDYPEKGYMSEFYLKQLSQNEYLYVVTTIRGAAYERERTRESRQRMLEDIVQTIQVANTST